MNMTALINSPGMWIACSIMVLTVVAQSVIFFRNAMKHAPNVGLSKDQCTRGLRSAMITAIGPSFSPVIVMLSLVAVLGSPTAWMRMNDIGAARTELGMSNLAVGAIGEEMVAGNLTPDVFAAASWGMALNNVGWMLVALLLTHRMSKAISWLNAKYNPNWIKMMMSGAMLGLFGYLTASNILGKGDPNVQTSSIWGNVSPFIVAAVVSAASMIAISKFLKKYPRLQELALGISMILGMAAASIYYANVYSTFIVN